MEIGKRTFSTPILLITYNRPWHTKQVLDRIKIIKPEKLYLFNDGPKENNSKDTHNCQEVRNLVENINWECEINTNFVSKNLNCKYGPVTAINWLFSHEKSGIILEDDILPDESFFYFCERMLKKYEDNPEILMISGRNEVGKWKQKECTYFFTLGGCWGWATWKRAWRMFDPEIEDWSQETYEKLKDHYERKSQPMIKELKLGCDAVKYSAMDAWDYQWLFTKLKYGTKDIMPSVNLIRNIGFDDLATHSRSNKKDKLPVFQLADTDIGCKNADIDYDYINKAYKRYSLSIFVKQLAKFKKPIKALINRNSFFLPKAL